MFSGLGLRPPTLPPDMSMLSPYIRGAPCTLTTRTLARLLKQVITTSVNKLVHSDKFQLPNCSMVASQISYLF